jgi:hypothetical protein
MSDAALDTALQGFVWRPAGPPRCAADPVSEPVIRQWAEVLGDRNPVYVDAEAAVATGRPGVVAPPTMLQVWTMAGYRATVEQTRYEGAWGELLGLLREHGFDAIVATDCEQDYHEEIEPGRRLIQADEISAVSERKGTALGEGYFVTLTQRYRDAETDVLVGTALFRMLVYRPHEPGARGAVAERPLRPRPAITPDSAFWWEGVRANELLIQRCVGCGRLRHPPGPACPARHGLHLQLHGQSSPADAGLRLPARDRPARARRGGARRRRHRGRAAGGHPDRPARRGRVLLAGSRLAAAALPRPRRGGRPPMSIVLTDEQRDLRELAGGVLGGHAGSTQLWHELSACGLVGLTVPVGAGGAGLGLFELALVAEQQGRHAVAGPLVPALLGAWVLARTGAGDGAARDVLADAARGADIVVAALTRRPGQDARAGAVRAACDAGGWRLSGERPAVAGLAAADHAVVLADADG